MKLLKLLPILLLSLAVQAQHFTTEKTTTKKAQKLFQEGKGYIMQNDLDKCIEVMKKAVADDSIFIDGYEMIGEVYFQQQQYEKAIPFFEKVMQLADGYKSKIWYFMATAYWETGNYEACLNAVEKYLIAPDRFDDWVIDAKRMENNAIFSKEAVLHPVPFNPINLGDSVNTKTMDEYSPSITADNSILLFNRNIKTGVR
ncbi:MAG: tetratricopeptide repeat protein, partial [Pseudomonadota bacterium]